MKRTCRLSDVPTCQESKVWVFKDDPTPTMVKSQRAMKKVMCAVFFRSTGLMKPIKLEGQKIITANCICQREFISIEEVPNIDTTFRSVATAQSCGAGQELWFQHDGATCHTARATIDLFKDTFGDRLISRFGPVNWPPRSCDLTPLDYFLWGYVKSLVYADKPQTLDHLDDNIHPVIADIRPQMLEKVIENWTSRLDYIRARCGSHMPEILFKM
ncbi:putative LOC100569746 [Trichonephila clavipes]|nr:putative LOC100569746 [Trichonephila clavipes]